MLVMYNASGLVYLDKYVIYSISEKNDWKDIRKGERDYELQNYVYTLLNMKDF